MSGIETLLLCGALLASLESGRGQIQQEIPFDFEEGFIWIGVQAEVGDRNLELNFLLDTGASASVVDLSLARRLGLPMGRRVSVRVVGKTIGGYWPQHLAARAGEIILPDSFLAVDLGALSRSCSRPIHGLIGADFLRNRITQIDFAARKIRLLRNGGIHGAGHVIQLEEGPRGIAVPVTVSGEKVRMVRIDTGCASAMHWTRKGGAPTASVRQPVVAFSDFALPTGTADLQIGSFRVGPIPALLHRRPVLGRELGLLGNGVWSRFASVTIDLRSDRLVICP